MYNIYAKELGSSCTASGMFSTSSHRDSRWSPLTMPPSPWQCPPPLTMPPLPWQCPPAYLVYGGGRSSTNGSSCTVSGMFSTSSHRDSRCPPPPNNPPPPPDNAPQPTWCTVVADPLPMVPPAPSLECSPPLRTVTVGGPRWRWRSASTLWCPAPEPRTSGPWWRWGGAGSGISLPDLQQAFTSFYLSERGGFGNTYILRFFIIWILIFCCFSSGCSVIALC